MPTVFGYCSFSLFCHLWVCFTLNKFIPNRQNAISALKHTSLCFPGKMRAISLNTWKTIRNHQWYLEKVRKTSGHTRRRTMHNSGCAHVCEYVFAVWERPTDCVVTGTILATVFVYTEPLSHPNNQPLWAFLIPTQSQGSQVELATAAIRYSNTASWSTSHGLFFPHPLSPLFPLLQFPTWHRFEVHGMHTEWEPLGCVAGFLFFHNFADFCSTTYESKQAAVVWKTPTRLQRNADLNFCIVMVLARLVLARQLLVCDPPCMCVRW